MSLDVENLLSFVCLNINELGVMHMHFHQNVLEDI